MRMNLCAGLAGLLMAACGAPDGSAERGRRLLAQYQCGSCHAIPDVPGARGRVGPTLDRFGLRSYIAGEIANRPDTLTRWIEEPAALVPGTLMPDMGASAADARDMAAYLSALD
jgi:cytochrome c